jgi:NADH:ubiquinone oxidoreductase subunit F (NADH-binding)
MNRSDPALAERRATAPAEAVPALPRLLRGIPAHGGALSLDEHLHIHGDLPTGDRLAHRARRRAPSELIERIERAGLRGRGGGGFPTATKLRAVAGGRRRPIVVINAAEGEPASLKDRTLCELLPHLMLDGGALAAQALAADEVIVCVCESAPASVEAVATAIEERVRAHVGAPTRMRLDVVPGGFVAGQESALVNHLNGGPALPTFTPPMPFEQGVRRRPTLVSNAETFAHIALIARFGSRWFRELGTPSQPGSALVTLSGPVAHPGVYEIEYGASLSALLQAAGGMTSRPRAALLGGYAGAWIEGELLDGIALSDEHLAVHGATLGSGVVALLSERACPVAETARIARWLSTQSAGQCGPCLNGLDALAATVQEIASGTVRGNAGKRIERLAALVRRRGACAHPDGAVGFVLSALETFSATFADHARHGGCDGCARPAELPLPTRPPARNRRAELVPSR